LVQMGQGNFGHFEPTSTRGMRWSLGESDSIPGAGQR
jgi:hypothetical protein